MKAYLYALAALCFCLLCDISVQAADTTPPTIVQVQPAPGTLTTLTQITVTFSENVTGVNALDFLINGETATSVTGSEETYTFHFDQPAYGTVQILWDNDQSVFDEAGNRFNHLGPGATWQYTLLDTVAPTIALLTPAAGATVRQLT